MALNEGERPRDVLERKYRCKPAMSFAPETFTQTERMPGAKNRASQSGGDRKARGIFELVHS